MYLRLADASKKESPRINTGALKYNVSAKNYFKMLPT
jgi:hypothetical protein